MENKRNHVAHKIANKGLEILVRENEHEFGCVVLLTHGESDTHRIANSIFEKHANASGCFKIIAIAEKSIEQMTEDIPFGDQYEHLMAMDFSTYPVRWRSKKFVLSFKEGEE